MTTTLVVLATAILVFLATRYFYLTSLSFEFSIQRWKISQEMHAQYKQGRKDGIDSEKHNAKILAEMTAAIN